MGEDTQDSQVPLVEDEAIVDEALAAFDYPQIGKRSWGGAARYGIGGREDRLTYAAWWNETGIDCLTWGPADLSFDLEAHPEHPFRTVEDCLRHVLKQVENTDTKINFRSYDPALRNKYIDMGVTVLMERPKS
jgi:2-keto-3-deoxy-L-rhamnonate aldolase RhmA